MKVDNVTVYLEKKSRENLGDYNHDAYNFYHGHQRECGSTQQLWDTKTSGCIAGTFSNSFL